MGVELVGPCGGGAGVVGPHGKGESWMGPHGREWVAGVGSTTMLTGLNQQPRIQYKEIITHTTTKLK
jgi:hypothetical protein